MSATAAVRYARTTGALYLFIIVAALFGEVFVRGSLIDFGDPAATAANIQASQLLFRAGLAAELLNCAADVAVALLLYVLLRPVSQPLSLLAAFFRLTFVAVYIVTKLFEVGALVLLGAEPAGALGQTELATLAYTALRVHGLGYGVSLLFFGFWCVVAGHLIRRSGYLPKLIGTLLVIAGVGYVVFSIAQVLDPAFASDWLFPWLLLPAFIAELSLALWLSFKGVDVRGWRAEPAAGR